MGDFGRKIDRFIEIFVEQRGYVRVLEGLQNTVMIAVVLPVVFSPILSFSRTVTL